MVRGGSGSKFRDFGRGAYYRVCEAVWHLFLVAFGGGRSRVAAVFVRKLTCIYHRSASIYSDGEGLWRSRTAQSLEEGIRSTCHSNDHGRLAWTAGSRRLMDKRECYRMVRGATASESIQSATFSRIKRSFSGYYRTSLRRSLQECKVSIDTLPG